MKKGRNKDTRAWQRGILPLKNYLDTSKTQDLEPLLGAGPTSAQASCVSKVAMERIM